MDLKIGYYRFACRIIAGLANVSSTILIVIAGVCLTL